jgi:aldose sugar dehydrogenase
MNETPQVPFASTPKRTRPFFWIILLISTFLLVGTFIYFVLMKSVEPVQSPPVAAGDMSTGTPEIATETVLGSLDRPWDVAFLPTEQALFTERKGTLSAIRNGERTQLASINDVKVAGEGGLMGLAVDPDFLTNRFIYTCYNTVSDIRVVRWKVDDKVTELTDKQPIVTGMPVNPSGRHSGCRLAFGPDGFLWIGTGDTATAGLSPQTPQDPKSLGGKILRVDRDGKAATGNLEAPFDARIYSYGHRNTQGIVFLPQPRGDTIGYSAEHGSGVDDEVNILKKGNFGWDPDKAYTESNVPMTDLRKFPDAVRATWSSGSPTLAPSGLGVLVGQKWKDWNGALVLATLKAQHLRVLVLDSQSAVVREEKILENKGRLRDVERAIDGSLYITTDNGGGKDEIIRISPRH